MTGVRLDFVAGGPVLDEWDYPRIEGGLVLGWEADGQFRLDAPTGGAQVELALGDQVILFRTHIDPLDQVVTPAMVPTRAGVSRITRVTPVRPDTQPLTPVAYWLIRLE